MCCFKHHQHINLDILSPGLLNDTKFSTLSGTIVFCNNDVSAPPGATTKVFDDRFWFSPSFIREMHVTHLSHTTSTHTWHLFIYENLAFHFCNQLDGHAQSIRPSPAPWSSWSKLRVASQSTVPMCVKKHRPTADIHLCRQTFWRIAGVIFVIFLTIKK